MGIRGLFWWRPPCLYRSVIVNLKHDPSTAIRGVLREVRGSWFVLEQAEALTERGTSALSGGGKHLVHRDAVAFLQALPGGPTERENVDPQ